MLTASEIDQIVGPSFQTKSTIWKHFVFPADATSAKLPLDGRCTRANCSYHYNTICLRQSYCFWGYPWPFMDTPLSFPRQSQAMCPLVPHVAESCTKKARQYTEHVLACCTDSRPVGC